MLKELSFVSRLGVLPLLPGASVRFAQCQDVHRYTLLELNKGSIEILGRSPLKLQSTSRCFFFFYVFPFGFDISGWKLHDLGVGTVRPLWYFFNLQSHAV